MESTLTPTYSAVIGVADPTAAAVVKRLVVEHARFESATVVTNALVTVEAAGRLRPNVVLLADDSPGLRGSEVVGEIRHEAPDTQVIIIASGYDKSYLDGVDGVFRSVSITDPSTIVDALSAVAGFLDDPGDDDPERRLGRTDRRRHQDWSKVFAERRDADRRD